MIMIDKRQQTAKQHNRNIIKKGRKTYYNRKIIQP
jgi:hypothetical protein